MQTGDMLLTELIVGDGTAVLIRALEPIEGLDIMQRNRGLADKGDKVKPHDLCSGPSKLTKVHLITAIYIHTMFGMLCTRVLTKFPPNS